MIRREVGRTAPYVALNGHTMTAPIYLRADGSGNTYVINADAQCTEDCSACADGDPLPDW